MSAPVTIFTPRSISVSGTGPNPHDANTVLDSAVLDAISDLQDVTNTQLLFNQTKIIPTGMIYNGTDTYIASAMITYNLNP